MLQQMTPKIVFPFRFRPHFYGPFSSDISSALDLLGNSGLLSVSQIDYGIRDDFEIRQYVYELTETGKEVAKSVGEEYAEFVQVFEEQFAKLKNTGYHENTKVLSTAAKVKHILSSEKSRLTPDTISKKGKLLGWEIQKSDLLASVKLLVDTGLAKTSK
jgi:uncharacterized protein YwgA